MKATRLILAVPFILVSVLIEILQDMLEYIIETISGQSKKSF